MESQAASNKKLTVFAYECLGTAMLVYAVNLQAAFEFGVFAIPLTLFAIILIIGPVTGCHINPAVSLSVFLSNRFWSDDFKMLFTMLGAQFTGGFLGIFLVYLSLYNPVEGADSAIPATAVNALVPAAGTSTANAFLIETIVTWLFVQVILIVKTKKTTPSGEGFLGGLAVVFTLFVGIGISAARTGGCLNPAVGLAQTFQFNMIGAED
jgi:aquaporin Z